MGCIKSTLISVEKEAGDGRKGEGGEKAKKKKSSGEGKRMFILTGDALPFQMT